MEFKEEFLKRDESDDSDFEFEDGKTILGRLKEMNGSKNKALHSPSKKSFIPLFRGVKLLPPFFSNSQRRIVSLMDNHNKPLFSSMSLSNAGFKASDIGREASGLFEEAETDILHKASDSIAKFLNILNDRRDLKIKVNSEYFYECLYHFLLQINTDIYSKFDDTLKALAYFLKSKKKAFNLTDSDIELINEVFKDAFGQERSVRSQDLLPERKPFISTGLDPSNAVNYALPVEGLEGRFKPEYDNNGKPKHRFAGVLCALFDTGSKIRL